MPCDLEFTSSNPVNILFTCEDKAVYVYTVHLPFHTPLGGTRESFGTTVSCLVPWKLQIQILETTFPLVGVKYVHLPSPNCTLWEPHPPNCPFICMYIIMNIFPCISIYVYAMLARSMSYNYII